MSKILNKILVQDKVAEDPNENLQINESSDEDEKEEKKEKVKQDSYIVDVKMNNPDNTSDINVKININDDALSKASDIKPQEEEEKGGSGKKDEENGDSESGDEEGEKEGEKKEQLKAKDYSSIEEYYEELRKKVDETKNPWVDPEFANDKSLFNKQDGETILKEEVDFEEHRATLESDETPFFAFDHTSQNIDYEFQIKRGFINDKFFLNAAIMLFKRREEFFQNLLLDKEHIKENIKAGFCGFTFFINGEWKQITVDTQFLIEGSDNLALSNITTPNAFWLALFEKAYAKAFGTFEVLTSNSICDYLVDFTGGWARTKSFSFKREQERSEMDKKEIKNIFDDIVNCLNKKYLLGCLYYDDSKVNDDLASSDSQDQGQDEQITQNSMYIILDAQEYNGVKLIYLVNHWPKGKWTGPYSVDDENWEANKALADKLKYTVSQTDKTFWMDIQDWAGVFNRLYYCRIFPDSWSQFCIDGRWTSLTSGGAPPKVDIPWTPEKVLQDKGKTNFVGVGNTTTMKGTTTNLLGSTLKTKKATIVGKKGVGVGKSSKLLGSIAEEPLAASKKIAQPGVPGLASSNLNQTKKTNTSSGVKSQAIKKVASQVKEKAPREIIKRHNKVDTEDRFFLNPQYKLELGPKTKLIISLMQEDKKLQNDAYLKTAIIIVHCKGRNTRVWDIQEDKVVYGLEKIKDIKQEVDEKETKQKDLKLEIEEKEEKIGREIIIQLDYLEILKSLNEKRKKKIQRGEIIHLNLIPYLDYSAKYTVEKQQKQKNAILFSPHAVEAVFWLRIFASNNITISELPQPFQSTIESNWSLDNPTTSGGSRCLTEERLVTENSKWPINPQYIITFDSNIKMKIILRKTKGMSSGEGEKVGYILCKPDFSDEENVSLKQKKKMQETKSTFAFSKTTTTGLRVEQQAPEQIMGKTAGPQPPKMGIKSEVITRVMESTNRILENNRNNIVGISPKMFFNSAEYIEESSYNNTYCACLFKKYNRIDSPIILIPTLETSNVPFDFEINIYSNKLANITTLNTPNNQLLLGEWDNKNCGGCHLSEDERKDRFYKKNTNFDEKLTWYDNPKYSLVFKSDEPLSNVEFEICLSRSDILWKPIVAKGIVNSMLGIYLFENDKTSWKEKCLNKKEIDFLPKNYITLTFKFQTVPTNGFIIMPVTYGAGIKGPFLIMVKSREIFEFKKMD